MRERQLASWLVRPLHGKTDCVTVRRTRQRVVTSGEHESNPQKRNAFMFTSASLVPLSLSYYFRSILTKREHPRQLDRRGCSR